MSRFRILQAEQQGVFLLKFVGEIRLNLCQTIDRAIERIQNSPDLVTVVVDLSQASIVDSTTLGLIAKIGIFTNERGRVMPTLVCTSPDVCRMIESMGLEDLFVVLNDSRIEADDLRELTVQDATEEEVRKKVLDAHRTLMNLNEDNRNAFRDLVDALECQ